MASNPDQTVHDPVCHMDIEITAAAGRSDYDGNTYYFCSTGCKRDFDTDPPGVLQREAEYDHSQGADHEMMAGAASTSAGSSRPRWQFWKK
jgi:YHS domain-containing protein